MWLGCNIDMMNGVIFCGMYQPFTMSAINIISITNHI